MSESRYVANHVSEIEVPCGYIRTTPEDVDIGITGDLPSEAVVRDIMEQNIPADESGERHETNAFLMTARAQGGDLSLVAKFNPWALVDPPADPVCSMEFTGGEAVALAKWILAVFEKVSD